MKFLSVLLLLSSILLVTLSPLVSSKKVTNDSTPHYEELNNIFKMLGTIEQRINNTIQDNHESLAQSLQKVEDRVSQKQSEKETAFADYHETKASAKAAYEEAMKNVEEKERVLNMSKAQLVAAKEEAEQDRQQIRQEHETSEKHLSAELELLEKIRSMITAISSRSVKDHNDKCSKEWDCLPGYVCDDGLCKISGGGSCEKQDDCSSSLVCELNTCKPVLEGQCDSNAKCADSFVCEDHVCKSDLLGECESDNHCREGHTCQGGLCLRPHMGECENSNQCGDDLLCQDGKCRGMVTHSCQDNTECINGVACQNNQCQSPVEGLVCTENEGCTSLPQDPVHDVQVDKLEQMGWKIVYQTHYGHTTTESELKNLRDDGAFFCVAGRKKGNNNLMTAAFGINEDVFLIKDRENSAPKASNTNVHWYLSPDESFGFAPNSNIELNSADVHARNDDDRVSWHLSGGGGWRVGSITGLNSDNDYEKIVMKFKPQQ
eukprot:gb/GECH01007646.1/.p1 GENE.gb/GECH01007646.1/~~gb/GECH01007646.1/.p1  ORF type:complete len:490 (+),score=110.75 gb/GECH01007646.1/:1-1470(+)